MRTAESAATNSSASSPCSRPTTAITQRNPRTVCDLARTYEDGHELARAATWYRKRVQLAGWPEETWYATWRLGCCFMQSGRPEEGCGVPWSALGRSTMAGRTPMDTGRALPADQSEERVSKCASWPADTVPTVPRTPGCYYVGERELGLALVDELLCRTDLPPAYVSSLHENRRFHEH